MIHRPVDHVGVVPGTCVPAMEGYGGQSPGLCVGIHALKDQHEVLQPLAAVGVPGGHVGTATVHTAEIAASLKCSMCRYVCVCACV